MCFKIYKVSKVSFIIFIYIMKLLLITVLSKSVHLWVTWDKIISPFVRFATFLLSGAPREFFSSQTEAMTQKRLANYLNLSSPLVQLWLVPPFLPRHASPRSSPPPHLCAGYVSAPRGLCRHPCVCVCVFRSHSSGKNSGEAICTKQQSTVEPTDAVWWMKSPLRTVNKI